jgi:hypothetical protein
MGKVYRPAAERKDSRIAAAAAMSTTWLSLVSREFGATGMHNLLLQRIGFASFLACGCFLQIVRRRPPRLMP